VIEARNVFAIQRFSFQQLRRHTLAGSRVPSSFVRLSMLRGDGSSTAAQRTVIRRNTSTPLFESLFYFNDLHLGEGELATCVLQVSLYDRGRLGPHMLVGCVDMDLESVYSLPNHELWKQWVTVLEPRGRREGAQGQLKLCVTVLKAGDLPPDHSNEVGDDAEVEGEAVEGLGADPGDLTASNGLDLSLFSIGGAARSATVPFSVRVQAFAAKDLPRMDWTLGGSVRPYLQLTAGSKAARTRRRRGANVEWRQELDLTLQLPESGARAPPIRLTVFESSMTSADVPIAAMRFTLSELRSHSELYARPRWYPLYGAPREPEEHWHLRSGAKLARRMNNGFARPASDYRGSVLMSLAAGRELGPAKRRGLPLPEVAPPVNLILVAEVLQLDMVLPEERGMGAEVCVELVYGLKSVRTVMWYQAKGIREAGGDVFVSIGEKLAPQNALVYPRDLLGKDGSRTGARTLVPYGPDDGETGASSPDVFLNVWWNSPTVKKRRVAFGRIPIARLLRPNGPTLTEFPEEMSEAGIGGAASFQNWLPLYADALGVRKGSSTVRAARPQGALLVRLQLQQKPVDAKTGVSPAYVLGITDKEERAKKEEEERKEAKRVAAEMGEEEEDDDEEYEASKKAAAEKAKRGPGLFDPGGAFGAVPDPEVIQELRTRPYKLRVYVYQAAGLPVADADGGADPFVVVRFGKKVSRTQVCAATTSPAWFAEVPLDVDLPVCSRPDMLSFGAMVHNAKRVERARRQLAQQLYKSKMDKLPRDELGGREDVGDWVAEPDANPGGRLLEVPFKDGDWYQDGSGGGARAPGATGIARGGEESEEELAEEYENGDVLRWAVPSVQLTVYDKSPMGDEPLSVVSIPASRLWGRHSTGGEDEAKQILRHLPMRWYNLRAFEFKGARLNRKLEGNGGKILVALSIEGPCDSVAAVLDQREEELKEAAKPPVVPSNYAPGCVPLTSRHAGEGHPTIKAVTLRTQPAELQVLLLGVRDLKPLYGLPIASPAVEFELTGVLPIRQLNSTAPRVDHSSLIGRSIHSSRPSGSNANYRGQVMCLRGRFPLEEQCSPGLTIRVRDKRLGTTPIVGIATMAQLPVRSIPEPSAAELDEENKLFEYMRAVKTEHGDKPPSMRSGLSEISGTDLGGGHKRPRGAPAGDFVGGDDEEGFDPHGMGAPPEYLKGRAILKCGLEDTPGFTAPFYTQPICRQGGGASGEEDSVVGTVKFCLRKVPMVPTTVPNKVSAKEAEDRGEYTSLDHMSVDPSLDPIRELISVAQPQKLVVRAYVLRGVDLRPANSNGLSCPYLVASLGPRSQGTRAEAIEDTCCPPFFRCFEFKPALPGASSLTVRVMNASNSKLPGARDVLIGQTVVDLEDRWFNEEWQAKHGAMPPLERRPLVLRTDGSIQGKLELFVTIEDAGGAGPAFNITPPPPESVELRLIVWQAKGMQNRKVIMAQNDLFFRVSVEGKDRLGRPLLIDKSTDTHWFASGGLGSFNYRLVYRFELPLERPTLKISAWCRNPVGANDDTIGEAIIETESNAMNSNEKAKSQLAVMCGEMIRRLREKRKSGNKKDDVELLNPVPSGIGTESDRRWVKLYMQGKKGRSTGEVQIQFVLLSAKLADASPVGEAQDEPNRNPRLDKADRATLNLLNPLASLAIIIGPERLRQFVFFTILALVLALGLGLFAVIGNDFLSAYIQKRMGDSKGR